MEDQHLRDNEAGVSIIMSDATYKNKLTKKNKLGRLLWWWVYTFFFRTTGMPFLFCYKWRNILLRVFGAKIAKTAVVHASAKIWAPWNLVMDEHACIADHVDVYNVNRIVLGKHTTVSQRAFLCTASHNISSNDHELINEPIIINDYAWIAAEAFVGMGVTVGEGAVIGARSAVFKNVDPWTVVGGNPAKFIKKRILRSAE